jgi:hypothetical protein
MTGWLVLSSVALADPTATALTARIELPEGHVLRAADLKPVAVPEASLPPGIVTDTSSAVGRSLRVPLFPGEALRGEYLGEVRTAPESLVPEGHWLVTVDVRTTADDTDLVTLYAGGFCAVARGVTVVLKDSDLVAVPGEALPAVVRALGPDASVRRADPGLRACR